MRFALVALLLCTASPAKADWFLTTSEAKLSAAENGAGKTLTVLPPGTPVESDARAVPNDPSCKVTRGKLVGWVPCETLKLPDDALASVLELAAKEHADYNAPFKKRLATLQRLEAIEATLAVLNHTNRGLLDLAILVALDDTADSIGNWRRGADKNLEEGDVPKATPAAHDTFLRTHASLRYCGRDAPELDVDTVWRYWSQYRKESFAEKIAAFAISACPPAAVYPRTLSDLMSTNARHVRYVSLYPNGEGVKQALGLISIIPQHFEKESPDIVELELAFVHHAQQAVRGTSESAERTKALEKLEALSKRIAENRQGTF